MWSNTSLPTNCFLRQGYCNDNIYVQPQQRHLHLSLANFFNQIQTSRFLHLEPMKTMKLPLWHLIITNWAKESHIAAAKLTNSNLVLLAAKTQAQAETIAGIKMFWFSWLIKNSLLTSCIYFRQKIKQKNIVTAILHMKVRNSNSYSNSPRAPDLNFYTYYYHRDSPQAFIF